VSKNNDEVKALLGNVLDYFDASAQQVQKQLASHYDVMKDVVATLVGEEKQMRCCSLIECPSKRDYRRSMRKVIAVLEESRTAFKSKTLEKLRKDLVDELSRLD
jgi:hypothetical protein